ncbi:right-handed parallel beta-helix repeat-containing protein, partial [Microvirga aerilata]
MTIIEVPGPTGDAVKDTAAIKTAIQQANAAYLKDPLKAQVKVQLQEGTYVVTGDKDNPSVGPVELLSGVELTGFGTRGSTIKLEDHFDARINGIVRTALTDVENVTVSNLVIDGNRANNQGHQAGFICGIKENADGEEQRNITIDGVEVMNCTAYGINPHEITYNMVVKNSVAHNNGLDGFVADAVIGGTYENNVSYDNDRHGFNIQNATKDLVLKNNEAYDNGYGINPATGLVWGGAGITIQRGNIPPEGSSTIPWVTNIQITGGSYHGNNKEGILVKLSDKVTIDGVDVYGNLRQGVRIEGSTNTTLQNSEIYNNSQELHNEYDEVSIRLRNDFTDGNAQKFPYTYYSTDTQILNNTIYANGPVKARYGIREEPTNDDGGATRTTLQNNTVTGMATGGISVPNYSEVITGTAGNDVIAGSTGGEQMKGLGGDDTYTVNHSKDVVVEVAGEGANDHVLSSITYTLTANVEHLTLEGAKVSVDGKGINGYGNELANRITGNHLANELNGLDGNDTLDGGGGNDILDGGNGNDTYRVDSTGDVIVEKASSGLGGTDTVESTVSYTLSAQVENLFLMGSANINATGNSGANRLTGNSGNNVLNGLGGSDLMTGGLGNDTYYVDHTGDVVSEADGGGTDTVYSTLSLTLGQFVENLVLQETAVSGTGNTLNNAITGNDAANKLSGGAGNDVLSGGLGNDTLDGGADTDTAVYAGTRASYTIGGTSSERTVAGGSEGTDTLR